MCDEEKELVHEDVEVLFTEDVDILEDRLTDIIVAMGLKEEQTSAALRLISDALEEHHSNILDTFEDAVGELQEDSEE